MTDTELMVKELCRRHNGNIGGLAAWCIGYIGSLERDIDSARVALGAQPREMSIIDNLRDYVANNDS
jgi:hypothetical protein